MKARAIRALSPRLGAAFIVVLGTAIALGLQIVFSMLLAEDAYRLRALSNEERNISNEVQIVAEEVSSLGSPQNLADAAHSLGMVVDSAPVMIDISNDQVFGEAEPASSTNSKLASANLVPNSALGATTQFSQAVVAGALEDSPSVDTSTPSPQLVQSLFTENLIPASPTR